MLVVSRKAGEKLVIPELGIEITVVEVLGRAVRLGVTVPGLDSTTLREALDRCLRQMNLSYLISTGAIPADT